MSHLLRKLLHIQAKVAHLPGSIVILHAASFSGGQIGNFFGVAERRKWIPGFLETVIADEVFCRVEFRGRPREGAVGGLARRMSRSGSLEKDGSEIMLFVSSRSTQSDDS